MPTFDDPLQQLSEQGRLQLEQVIDQFEAAWTADQPPDIADFLPVENRLAALVELIHVDLDCRHRARLRVEAQPYLDRFPELCEIPVVVDELRTRETALRAAEVDGGVGSETSLKMTLEVVAGPHQGTAFEFDTHTLFIIGRSQSAHLPLPEDRFFSRHHFLLEINPPRCYLRDLGSRNGTFLNGARVKEAYVKSGDVFGGGRTLLRLKVERPSAEAITTELQCHQCGVSFIDETLSVPGVPGPPTICHSCRVPPTVLPSPALPHGVPGYEFIRKLGQGGMGEVYLARRDGTGERVAIKLIRPEVATNERLVQIFLREVSILSQLDHPRIVRFHEIGFRHGKFYFAMDYVETVDLLATLGKSSPPNRIRAACGILCQILDALQQAHQLGFVHRDIKPANILLSREGMKLRAKLADFGLAKNFETSGFSGITRLGEMRGSLPFMAPEQVLDCRDAKPPADLYSAGATLYYLISRSTPHSFGPDRDPIVVVLEDDPTPIQNLVPEVPDALAEVIRRSLAREPADRFASALEMRQALLPFARSG